MNESFLLDLLDEFPDSLREQVANFMAFADEAAESIYESIDVDPSPAVVDNFVALAGIWRLWRMIDSPFQLAQSALRLLDATSAAEFQLGASLYSYQSPPVRLLTNLRRDLESTLVEAELTPLSQHRALRDVAFYALAITDG